MYEAGGAGRSGGECSGPESGPECAEAAELRGRIAELSGTLNVATAGLVDAIARVIELDAWGGGGYRSVEHWVSLHCGVSARHARVLVLMARRVEQFPQVMGKFREGRLSEDQVRPIVAHVPDGYDESCATMAEHMAVPQLERLMRSYAFGESPPSAKDLAERDNHNNDDDKADDDRAKDDEDEYREERDREQRQYLSFGHDDEVGLWRLRGGLSPELGEIVAAALRVFRDEIFNEGGKASWHAALVRMAEVAMAAHGESKDRKGHDRYQVLLHVRADQVDDLTGTEPTERAAYFHLGPLVSQRMAPYVSCDASVRLIINEDRRVVSVEHKQHTVPDHTRLAVMHRDGGACRVPGCISTQGLEVHHIRHWEDGGPTDTWNLMAGCGCHHRAIHRGEIIVEGNADIPDGLTFTDRWGKPLGGPPPKPPPGPPPTGNWRHPSGEHLDYSNVHINRD